MTSTTPKPLLSLSGTPKTAPATSSASSDGVVRGPSLYELGVASQDIAGEIALAATLLESDDEDERTSAIALIESYLEQQEQTKAALFNKADNVCYYIDSLLGQADFREQQAKRLQELADADRRRAETLKKTLLYVLERLHPESTKFSLPTHELRARRSSVVVIEDETAIPNDYLRTKTTVSPDKTAIKQAIKVGTPVPGCSIEERKSWSIK